MCILFFALQQHPKYPVIICANRDEFHQRPTQAMHFWPQQSPTEVQILAGKDLQAGGTWLGLTLEGRFAALTNFRQVTTSMGDTPDEIKKSRGDLVLKALKKTDQEVMTVLVNESANYLGFNLIFGELENLYYFDSINKTSKKLPSGVHSLCNGALDDIWPKMALGQSQLIKAIDNSTKIDTALNIEQLFDLMKNSQQASPTQLPKTGISEEWEQFLSSIFIVSPEYGTRTTTIITQDNHGNIVIADRSYNIQGQCSLEQNFKVSHQMIS